MWRHFDPKNFPFTMTTVYLEILGQLLGYSNACINPVVYAFVSKPFRKDFRNVVGCCKVCGAFRPKLRDNAKCANKQDGANNTKFTLDMSDNNLKKKKLLDCSKADCCKNSLHVKN